LGKVQVLVRNFASGIFGHCVVPIHRLLSHFTPPHENGKNMESQNKDEEIAHPPSRLLIPRRIDQKWIPHLTQKN
jgi:hypothetical protein